MELLLVVVSCLLCSNKEGAENEIACSPSGRHGATSHCSPSSSLPRRCSRPSSPSAMMSSSARGLARRCHAARQNAAPAGVPPRRPCLHHHVPFKLARCRKFGRRSARPGEFAGHSCSFPPSPRATLDLAVPPTLLRVVRKRRK
uniref:Secreted protein n=1 Tax=Setaria viridis TaxID=4556 RepID=A0A4U6TW81_SETVI|nr:hypothetical protein SEVIR_7G173800v2 [Setaria viridis]